MIASLCQDCLRLFSKEEKLTDNNKVFCRHCKAHRDSTKKLEIWKVPPIVLVHLKRCVVVLGFQNSPWLRTSLSCVIFGVDFSFAHFHILENKFFHFFT